MQQQPQEWTWDTGSLVWLTVVGLIVWRVFFW